MTSASPPTADDPFDQFALSALFAISVFAGQECAAIARRVRHALRRQRASGIFGDDYGHRHLWGEYRFEVRHGPTMGLESAWAITLRPFIAREIAALDRPTAVLLTIAAEDAVGGLRSQSGGTVSEDAIAGAIRNALYRLADESQV